MGQLRWAKPAPPLKTEGIQDGSEGRSCTQSSRLGLGAASASPPGEDCLFLDVTVPGKAIKTPGAKLPVMGMFLVRFNRCFRAEIGDSVVLWWCLFCWFEGAEVGDFE